MNPNTLNPYGAAILDEAIFFPYHSDVYNATVMHLHDLI